MGANSLTYPSAVSGFCFVAQDTFTRPADTTAYASGDLVANSTTAATVQSSGILEFTNVGFGGGLRLEAVRIRKTGTTTTNGSFRVHFWNARPATVTNGDNGAFSISGAANYLGAFDVSTDRAFTDGAAGRGLAVTGSPLNVTLHTGTTLYGLVEARAAYTPASGESFSIIVEGYRFAA